MKYCLIIIQCIVSYSSFSQTEQELIFASYYGGIEGELVFDIDKSENGNIYIVGVTSSSSDIATVGSHQENLNGINDGFILALDSNYSVLWSTYFGGEEQETIYSVAP